MDDTISHNPDRREWSGTADETRHQAVSEWDEDDLIQRATLLHAAGSLTNADTFMVSVKGHPVVLKSFRNRALPVRVLFTRKTLRHEFQAMKQIQDLPGIPRVYGYVGKDSMLMEYIDGAGPLQDSRELVPEAYPPPGFFQRLKTLLEGMHARGVSHGDIRRRNIMRGRNDQPYLIDFATAVNTHGRLAWLRRRLFAMFSRADRFAVAKLISTYYPDMLTDGDKARLQDVPWYLKTGRFLRKKVYRRFIKQKRWRERWTKLMGFRS